MNAHDPSPRIRSFIRLQRVEWFRIPSFPDRGGLDLNHQGTAIGGALATVGLDLVHSLAWARGQGYAEARPGVPTPSLAGSSPGMTMIGAEMTLIGSYWGGPWDGRNVAITRRHTRCDSWYIDGVRRPIGEVLPVLACIDLGVVVDHPTCFPVTPLPSWLIHATGNDDWLALLATGNLLRRPHLIFSDDPCVRIWCPDVWRIGTTDAGLAYLAADEGDRSNGDEL